MDLKSPVDLTIIGFPTCSFLSVSKFDLLLKVHRGTYVSHPRLSRASKLSIRIKKREKKEKIGSFRRHCALTYVDCRVTQLIRELNVTSINYYLGMTINIPEISAPYREQIINR